MNDYEFYVNAKEMLEEDYEEALKEHCLFGIGIYEYKFFDRCRAYRAIIFRKYEKCDTFTELMSNVSTWDMELIGLIDRLEKQYNALKYTQSLEEVEKEFYKFKKKVKQNN